VLIDPEVEAETDDNVKILAVINITDKLVVADSNSTMSENLLEDVLMLESLKHECELKNEKDTIFRNLIDFLVS